MNARSTFESSSRCVSKATPSSAARTGVRPTGRPLGGGVGAVRDTKTVCGAARSVHSVSNAQPRRRHRRVRVLFREGNVAGGVDGRVARPQGRIGLHAPISYL